MKRFLKYFSLLVLLFAAAYLLFLRKDYPLATVVHSLTVGDSLDSYNGVIVYNNGANYSKSYGRHYSSDSTYYGKKWQCVEFIKRYYFDHLHFVFKDGMGHAKSFYDPNIKSGKLNRQRGLLQFANGMNSCPRPDDILVFDGSFGHVAIVTSVTKNTVEVIQQNIYMRPRQEFKLTLVDGNYTVGDSRKPLGWLRKD